MYLLEFIGDLIEILGKLLVAWAAIMVHHRFKHEHKVDDAVFKVMQWETRLGGLGIAMIIVGFSIRTYATYILL